MDTIDPLFLNERGAVVVFFVLAFILCGMTLLFTLKAIRNREYTLWYTIGIFAGTTATLLCNVYAGAIYIAASLMLARKAWERE